MDKPNFSQSDSPAVKLPISWAESARLDGEINRWLYKNYYTFTPEETRPFYRVAYISLATGVTSGFLTTQLWSRSAFKNSRMLPAWLAGLCTGLLTTSFTSRCLKKSVFEQILLLPPSPLTDKAREIIHSCRGNTTGSVSPQPTENKVSNSPLTSNRDQFYTIKDPFTKYNDQNMADVNKEKNRPYEEFHPNSEFQKSDAWDPASSGRWYTGSSAAFDQPVPDRFEEIEAYSQSGFHSDPFSSFNSDKVTAPYVEEHQDKQDRFNNQENPTYFNSSVAQPSYTNWDQIRKPEIKS